MSIPAASPDYEALMKRALLEIEKLQSRQRALESSFAEPIAIVGLGCRFPGGGDNPESFWRMLCAGVDAIEEVPRERWDLAAYYDPNHDAPGKIYTRWGSFLRAVDSFDSELFGIAPREADMMDPQQRILLEVVWEALENAAISPIGLRGDRVGVFMGLMNLDYLEQVGSPELFDAHTSTGNAQSVIAGRLSYLLGLRGPALVVDTACSSSLVAVHLACQSLRCKESDMALAGGVNLVLSPLRTVVICRAKMLSQDGRCKVFDRRADGYVRGEGCGVVVLKRLSTALAANDRVLAVIRGSAVNQDGPSAGLTVPYGPSQEDVIRRALADGGVEPAAVAFIEAHGSGTALGDPIEIESLANVFGRRHPLWVGAVKSNLGHLESAAGIAGLIKTVLALQYGVIPPNLHFQDPNPKIPWDDLAFKVPTAGQPWPADRPRIAGVSSFGFSGTNAHVVVALPPDAVADEGKASPPAPAAVRQHHLLTLAAKTESALRRLAERYERHGSQPDLPALADLCATSHSGRAQLEERLAVVGTSAAEVAGSLKAYLAGQDPVTVVRGRARRGLKVAFLCSGQGAQAPGVGQQLYAAEPRFRAALERCAEILGDRLERPLLSLLFPPAGAAADRLHHTANTQPALFAFAVALAELWQSWGVRPSLLLGHSIGELVAAHLAGVFSLADGLLLAAERGRLMAELTSPGEMWALEIAEPAAAELLAARRDQLAIAAVNGPHSVVISGDSVAAQEVIARLDPQIRRRRLVVSHAFHSPLMEPMLDAFARCAAQVRFAKPTLPLISNLSGRLAGDEIATPQYWVDHVRQTVRFVDGVRALAAAGCDALLEVGPRPVLLGLVGGLLPQSELSRELIPSLTEQRAEEEQMLLGLGRFYALGGTPEWRQLDGDGRRNVELPTYPFERRRHWVTATDQGQGRRFRAGGELQQLLAQGDTPAVVERLRRAGEFADQEAASLSRVVSELVRQLEHEHTARALDEWLYELRWQPAVAAARHDHGGERPGWWLIFADHGGTGKELARQLAARQRHSVLIQDASRSGGEPLAVDGAIDPGAADAGEQLRAIFAANPETLAGAVFLWSLDAQEPAAVDAPTALAQLRAEHARLCGGVLHLLQALVASQQQESAKLWLVTRQGVAVSDQPERLALAQAPLWGLGRSIALEHPELWGGLLDLEPAGHPAAEQILQVILDPQSEPHLAVRGGRNHVARLTLAAAPPRREFVLSQTASYLITGGLGGLGLELARWLAARGARHLVLTGRSGAASPAAQAAVRQLETQGVRVLVEKADVANAADIDRLFAAMASLPQLRGVIHAAGVLDDGVLLQQNWQRFARVMAPKVEGAFHLDQKTRDLELDFFVLFSSAASLLGSRGQSNYATANAFLDALAHCRRQQGLPALSLNWGPWSTVGMAHDQGNERASGLTARSPERASGLTALSPAQGLQVLERLLGDRGRAQVGVLPIEPAAFREIAGDSPIVAELLRQLGGDPNPGASVGQTFRELAALTPAARPAQLVTWVRQEVARALGYETGRLPDKDRGFAELGMDSLMAIELKNRLQRSLDREFSPTVIFNYPTAETLARYLDEKLFPSAPAAAPPGAAPTLASLALTPSTHLPLPSPLLVPAVAQTVPPARLAAAALTDSAAAAIIAAKYSKYSTYSKYSKDKLWAGEAS